MSDATPGRTPRDLQAEQDRAEFAGWFEAQGYPSPDDRYDGDEMAEAFTAGMRAQRDLGPVSPADRATREALAAIDPDKLETLADWFDMDDARKGLTGTEVQSDLRRWAQLVRGEHLWNLSPDAAREQPASDKHRERLVELLAEIPFKFFPDWGFEYKDDIAGRQAVQ